MEVGKSIEAVGKGAAAAELRIRDGVKMIDGTAVALLAVARPQAGGRIRPDSLEDGVGRLEIEAFPDKHGHSGVVARAATPRLGGRVEVAKGGSTADGGAVSSKAEAPQTTEIGSEEKHRRPCAEQIDKPLYGRPWSKWIVRVLEHQCCDSLMLVDAVAEVFAIRHIREPFSSQGEDGNGPFELPCTVEYDIEAGSVMLGDVPAIGEVGDFERGHGSHEVCVQAGASDFAILARVLIEVQ